ncbi:PC4 and SFRS1-interacting protein-like isoform X1 [Amphibalanus amphitrite]|uniref:PC4 and SFRS1-interacting protein-like isoform X1 n=1 Tax=Amphibalanus amphitrite TaxID=1232801 RepID=UPI001C9254B1|nr:PC4 and SFRS1-interacting protein-like isoform X1 [Amphibalanus amphitrite]
MKGDVFEPNALVFAKIRGYPAWPAKVTAPLDDSKKPKKYSVFFFGTYEVATVKVEDLFAYNEKTKEKFGNVNVKRKGFLEAMQEIESSPDMDVTVVPPPATTAATPRPAAATLPGGTPKGRGRGKKRKEDASTPLESTAGKRRRVDSGDGPGATSAAPAAEPVLSRSGRKIKPKRFADADEGQTKSPATGRRQPASTPVVEPSIGEDATTPVVRREDTGEDEDEDDPMAEDEGEEVLPMDVAEGGAGDGPHEEAAQPVEEPVERRDVRYKPYPAHETEDIVRVADSASVQDTDDGRKVMYVKAKCGEMLEIDISDKERPKEFKSEKARIMWDTATAINLARLRHQLEQGEYIPDRLREKLLARADVADELKDKLKNDKKAEMRKSKLWWLRDEARMIEMDYHIKLNLIIDEQNHDKCIEVFKELSVMNMAPLMLKKNPEIVETVRKCRKYTGSAEIRELADKCYQRFKKMFVVPKGKMFREYFDEQLAMFRKVTEEMPEDKVVRMVRDPLFQRPGEESSDSEDENWPPAPPKTNGVAEKDKQTNGTGPADSQRKDKDKAGDPLDAQKEKDGAAKTEDETKDEPPAVAEEPAPAAEASTEGGSPQKAAGEAEPEPTAGGDTPAAETAAEETPARTETETAEGDMETAETEPSEEPAAKEAAETEEPSAAEEKESAEPAEQ